jgi:hypothetical protein
MHVMKHQNYTANSKKDVFDKKRKLINRKWTIKNVNQQYLFLFEANDITI